MCISYGLQSTNIKHQYIIVFIIINVIGNITFECQSFLRFPYYMSRFHIHTHTNKAKAELSQHGKTTYKTLIEVLK